MSAYETALTMSRIKTKAAKGPAHSETGWPAKITELRVALGLTKAQLAKKIDVSHVAVGSWESGDQEPSPQWLIALGNLAAESGKADPMWFWERAGLNPAYLSAGPGREARKRLMDAIFRRTDEVAARFESDLRGARIAVVPLLKGPTHVANPLSAPTAEIEEWFPLPTRWIGNRATTSILRMRDPESSVLGGEDLAVIDASRADAESLWTEMIAASHGGQVMVGWLHPFESRDGGRRVMVLTRTRTVEETSALRQVDLHIPGRAARKPVTYVFNMLDAAIRLGWAIPMEPISDWRILGRVIGWIGRAEPK